MEGQTDGQTLTVIILHTNRSLAPSVGPQCTLPKLPKWFTPLKKMAARAINKTYCKTTSALEPQVQNPSYLSEMFLIMPFAKIALIFLFLKKKQEGCQSCR